VSGCCSVYSVADAPPPDAPPPDARPPDAPPPDACVPTVTAAPTTLYTLQQPDTVYTGSCFTPSSNVQIDQFSGWFEPCRGVIIVPGTTRPVDAQGRFSFQLPATALAFTLYVGPASLTFTDVGGGTSTVDLSFIDGGSANVFVKPTDPSAPIVAVGAGEQGSGEIRAATDGGINGSGIGSFRFDFVLALHGALPDHTYGIFLGANQQCTSLGTSTGVATTRGYGTVHTDASGDGSAFFHTYLAGEKSAGWFTPVLSLTSDAHAPSAGNVAYQATVGAIQQFTF